MRAHRAPESMSLAEARRTTLRSQGLARGRSPGERAAPAGVRALTGVVDRLGLLQIDSVNVLARAHLMPVYSRIGPYAPELVDRASGTAPRRLIETWAHMASFVPPTTYPLLAWRRADYRREAWPSIADVPLEHAPLVARVRDVVAEHGPVTAARVGELLAADHAPERGADWGWNWTAAKRVLEFLFFTGEVLSSSRTASFERRYDLAERVLPASARDAPEPSRDDAVRALVEISARALGVGTIGCLADYFRLRKTPTGRAVAELVEEGVLSPVRVEGWPGLQYRHRDATTPRRAAGRALLSPFDPLVFERTRLEHLFGVRYRIEIYVPAERRVYGYYALPFLLGDRIAALVDLKADRPAGVLRVLATHAPAPGDPGPGERHGAPQPPAEVAHELAAELRLLATWLHLDDIEVAPVGTSAPALAEALPHAH